MTAHHATMEEAWSSGVYLQAFQGHLEPRHMKQDSRLAGTTGLIQHGSRSWQS